MLARMQNGLRSIGRNIRSSGNSRRPGLHSDNPTQRTWARVIECYENVPEVFKSFFDPHRASGRAFPYTIFTPGLETRECKITAKLVSAFEHETVFLEENGKGLAAQIYPLNGIGFVKMSSMLLDSRFELHGWTTGGIQTSSTARFSTATDYLFTPVLIKKDPAACGSVRWSRSSSRRGNIRWMDHFRFQIHEPGAAQPAGRRPGSPCHPATGAPHK